MLIIGTGGMAREVAGIVEFDHPYNKLYFFNNLDKSKSKLWNRYPIFHTEEEITHHFKTVNNKFISCIANPLLRKKFLERMVGLGGKPDNAISYRADISHFVNFDKNIVIQPACVVASDVTLKKGVFLNANAIVGHDSIIGEYVSLGPGCRILGNVEIDEFSYIGCNAIIAPGVKIGKKVRIGMAKVITEDVPDGSKII